VVKGKLLLSKDTAFAINIETKKDSINMNLFQLDYTCLMNNKLMVSPVLKI
jgi:hypothetical protein